MIEMMPPYLLYHSHNTTEVSYQTKFVPTAFFFRKYIYKTFYF